LGSENTGDDVVIIGFCACCRIQSEPSQDKFLRRLSVSVRVIFCCFCEYDRLDNEFSRDFCISDGDDSVEEFFFIIIK